MDEQLRELLESNDPAMRRRGLSMAKKMGLEVTITDMESYLNPTDWTSENVETIEKQIDSTTVILLYILSFFIPLAGFIVGAIYASKDEEHYKHVGKNCLIFSVINIVLGFIMIAAIFA